MVYLGFCLRLLRSNSANSSLRRRKRRFTSNASSRSASALARCFLALLAWATALSKLIRLAIAVSLGITSFSGPEEYGLSRCSVGKAFQPCLVRFLYKPDSGWGGNSDGANYTLLELRISNVTWVV
jgi:hypothetical protein